MGLQSKTTAETKKKRKQSSTRKRGLENGIYSQAPEIPFMWLRFIKGLMVSCRREAKTATQTRTTITKQNKAKMVKPRYELSFPFAPHDCTVAMCAVNCQVSVLFRFHCSVLLGLTSRSSHFIVKNKIAHVHVIIITTIVLHGWFGR